MQKIKILIIVVLQLISANLIAMEKIAQKMAAPERAKMREKLQELKQRLPKGMQENIRNIATRIKSLESISRDTEKEEELQTLREKLGRQKMEIINLINTRGRDNINFSDGDRQFTNRVLKELE